MGATFPRRCLGLRDGAPLALGRREAQRGQEEGQYFGLRREAQRHAALVFRGAVGDPSQSAVAASTAQAERPGPRDATIATATLTPG